VGEEEAWNMNTCGEDAWNVHTCGGGGMEHTHVWGRRNGTYTRVEYGAWNTNTRWIKYSA